MSDIQDFEPLVNRLDPLNESIRHAYLLQEMAKMDEASRIDYAERAIRCQALRWTLCIY
jgi:hypothetical protein